MSDSAEDRALALVGHALGPGYRLEAMIGQGAMGAVYRATSPSGGEVALKTLSPEVMGDQTNQRFLRESELVRGLKHPHVVRTLDSGVDDRTGLMFLVMPLLKGRDLDHVLDELGALEPETAVRIALQAARGLSAAHRIGIIHRDVKPGNLILDEEDGEIIVRVCDFGIAKQIGGSELTKTGSQLGTPDYVSPEQLKSSKHVDERADVWSLGATLYQLLCGAAPYSHIDAVFDVITAIMTEDVPHLQDRAPWIQPELALIVHKALQRDPDQRWATLEDMADALRPFSGGDELLDRTRIRAASAERKSSVAGRADVTQAAQQTSLPAQPLTEMDELRLVGQKLDGRYLVKRLIGKGGMGNVYEVEGAGGDRLAAKVVSAGVHGASPSTLQRFAREAKSSAVVISPHVVRTVDAGCDDKLGFPYIIMELLHGVDLSSVLKREGALAADVAVRLIVQAARGVAAAHLQGVVHRDIKPANLFLQRDPRTSEITVKVCDFGVAKRLAGFGFVSSGGGGQSLTRSGGVVGSPMYMSPEQARNAKAVNERTDVWSLSVVLWEALSGQRLWGGQISLGELIIAICTEPIARLEAAAPWVPRELARIVHRGLERDLTKRTPSMEALIQELEAFGGSSDRIEMSQLKGLSEAERSELSLKVNLTDSAARHLADLGKMPAASAPAAHNGSSRNNGSSQSNGSSRSAMLGVALLSAAVAGGSAFYFARSYSARSSSASIPPSADAAPAPTTQPRPEADPTADTRPTVDARPHPVASAAAANVAARVQIVPPDAHVRTPHGAVPVVAGQAVLRGRAGESLLVTLQRGSTSKTFSVSLGSDGIASPGRLVLPP